MRAGRPCASLAWAGRGRVLRSRARRRTERGPSPRKDRARRTGGPRWALVLVTDPVVWGPDLSPERSALPVVLVAPLTSAANRGPSSPGRRMALGRGRHHRRRRRVLVAGPRRVLEGHVPRWPGRVVGDPQVQGAAKDGVGRHWAIEVVGKPGLPPGSGDGSGRLGSGSVTRTVGALRSPCRPCRSLDLGGQPRPVLAREAHGARARSPWSVTNCGPSSPGRHMALGRGCHHRRPRVLVTDPVVWGPDLSPERSALSGPPVVLVAPLTSAANRGPSSPGRHMALGRGRHGPSPTAACTRQGGS